MTSQHLVTKPRIDVVKFELGDDIVQDLDVPVKVRDGASLAVNVFRPRRAGRYPVIIAVSPYGKDRNDQADLFRKLPYAHLGYIETSLAPRSRRRNPGSGYPTAML